MSTFLGIGLGPIQTGIFLSGAFKGGVDKIVIAEVDNNLKDAINANNGNLTINIADSEKIYQETYSGIEVYNPLNEDDLEKLIAIAGDADEIATALPSVDFFKHIAPWLKKGFDLSPEKERFIYTAENNNHAAECLEKAIDKKYSNTNYLNTVVGKMSGVVSNEECEEQNLSLLCPNSDKGHLVEKFNNIYISKVPNIVNRNIEGLYEKDDLFPFEEAKLYGHNAIHILLGILSNQKGKKYMHQIKSDSEVMKFARTAFIDESGKALCKKYTGIDELFTEKGFAHYADDLLERMTNPFLQDAVERVLRDADRKLAWEDRIIGTMRLALEYDVIPCNVAKTAKIFAKDSFGIDYKTKFKDLWPSPWTNEHEEVLNLF